MTATPDKIPIISVVIPTRHRNDLLGHCLDRLAPGVQQFPAERYEVIVTDDGSSPTAETFVRERYPWARWLRGPQRGPAANRNFGASQAKGTWLAFTDDDCLPDIDWLQIFHQSLQPQVSIYEGKTTSNDGVLSPLVYAPTNDQGGNLWSCNMMIARALFQRLGGFDETFPHAHMEDVDFRERVLGQNEKILFVPTALVDHPARKSAVGAHIAPTHESEFLFYYKSGHTKPYLAQHLRRVLSVRLRYLARFPLSRDSVTYAFAIVPELWYVLRHGGAWQKKYKKIYSGIPTPYGPGVEERVGQH